MAPKGSPISPPALDFGKIPASPASPGDAGGTSEGSKGKKKKAKSPVSTAKAGDISSRPVKAMPTAERGAGKKKKSPPKKKKSPIKKANDGGLTFAKTEPGQTEVDFDDADGDGLLLTYRNAAREANAKEQHLVALDALFAKLFRAMDTDADGLVALAEISSRVPGIGELTARGATATGEAASGGGGGTGGVSLQLPKSFQMAAFTTEMHRVAALLDVADFEANVLALFRLFEGGDKNPRSLPPPPGAVAKPQPVLLGKPMANGAAAAVDVSDASKAQTSGEAASGFAAGVKVYVTRSDGTKSEAWVDEYDGASQMYRVELHSKGSGEFKTCMANQVVAAEAIDAAAAKTRAAAKYEIGQRVLVQRSGGDESVCFVASFDAEKHLYTVALYAPDSHAYKSNVPEDKLRDTAGAAGETALPAARFENGTKVFVKRSSGEEAPAFVVAYDEKKRLYKLALGESADDPKAAFKYAPQKMCRLPEEKPMTPPPKPKPAAPPAAAPAPPAASASAQASAAPPPAEPAGAAPAKPEPQSAPMQPEAPAVAPGPRPPVRVPKFYLHQKLVVPRSDGSTAEAYAQEFAYDMPGRNGDKYGGFYRVTLGDPKSEASKWVPGKQVKPADEKAPPPANAQWIDDTPDQIFKDHEKVLAKRSSGAEQVAHIASFDRKNKIYTVDLGVANGHTIYKHVPADGGMLRKWEDPAGGADAKPAVVYEPGARVIAKRSDKSEVLAFIEQWVGEHMAYKVAMHDPNSGEYKLVKTSDLRKAAVPAKPVGYRVMVRRNDKRLVPGVISDFDPVTSLYAVDLESNEFMRVPFAGMSDAPPESGFAIGARVLIKRSSGEESLAFVRSFDAKSAAYEVAIGSPDSETHKLARVVDLRIATESAYEQGQAVLVKRPNGTEALAYVMKYDEKEGKHVVAIGAADSGIMKLIGEKDMRAIGRDELAGWQKNDSHMPSAPRLPAFNPAMAKPATNRQKWQGAKQKAVSAARAQAATARSAAAAAAAANHDNPGAEPASPDAAVASPDAGAASPDAAGASPDAVADAGAAVADAIAADADDDDDDPVDV